MADEAGNDLGIITKLSHLPVAEIVARLTGLVNASAELAGNLAGINALTDALVAS